MTTMTTHYPLMASNASAARYENRPVAMARAVAIDRQTVELAQIGNQDACSVILSTFEAAIRKTVTKLAGWRLASQIEDIMQDVMLRVVGRLPQFDAHKVARLPGWIVAVTRNYCLDVLKRRRLPTVSIHQEDDSGRKPELVNDDRGPRSHAEHVELRGRIEVAIANLTPKQRSAFVLRQFSGLSYARIGELTDCSEATAKTRVVRAKESLRNQLVEDQPRT